METIRLDEVKWLRYDINYIRSDVPAEPGAYALSCPKGRVIYVGKAVNPAFDHDWIELR